MSNHFNELLLQTLKEVGIRLERLEGRVDHVINEKADKVDVKDVKAELKSVSEKLDQKADKTDVTNVRTELKAVSEKLDQKTDKAELKSVSEKLDQKADKTDVTNVRTELKDVRTELKEEISTLRDEVRSQGTRLDRIETGIRTLQWTMTAGLAVLGIILAFMRAC